MTRKQKTTKGNGVTPQRHVVVEDRDVVEVVPVTVHRVTCDGSLPGGFRIVVVPVEPGERI